MLPFFAFISRWIESTTARPTMAMSWWLTYKSAAMVVVLPFCWYLWQPTKTLFLFILLTLFCILKFKTWMVLKVTWSSSEMIVFCFRFSASQISPISLPHVVIETSRKESAACDRDGKILSFFCITENHWHQLLALLDTEVYRSWWWGVLMVIVIQFDG